MTPALAALAPLLASGRRLRIGSLFSGYRGLDLGLEAILPADTVWVSDLDSGPVKVLAHHLPDAPNLGDVTLVDWDAVERIEVLTGGFPCQDVSLAGLRRGMVPGTRSGLWQHMALAIDKLRPRLVVAENVRGLLSAEAGGSLEPCPWCVGDPDHVPLRALGGVLGDLAELGYDAQWVGLQAADVGAPHGRFRVFVVAWPRDAADADRLGRAGGTEADGGGREDGGRSRAATAGPRPGAAADAGGLGRAQPAEHGEGGRAGGPAPEGGQAVRARGAVPGPAAQDPDLAVGGERRLAAPGQAEGGGSRPDARGRVGAPPADADRVAAGGDPGDGRPVPAAARGAEDRAGGPPADAEGDGRDEGRAEPTGLVGGPHAAVGGAAAPPHADDDERLGERRERAGGAPAAGCGAAAPTDADRDGRARVGGLGGGERDPHGRDGAHGDGHPGEPEARPQWGVYAPAVERWERVTGRVAPAPTEQDWTAWRTRRASLLKRRRASRMPVGRRGSLAPATTPPGHRLSPRFVEWMMGLPAGHVTAVPGLSRNEKLKLLGNGVVPQQAAAAVLHVLEGARP